MKFVGVGGRAVGFKSLLGFLLLIAGLIAFAPSAQGAGTGVGNFEIDGNLADDPAGSAIDPPGTAIDWATAPNLTNFTDPPPGTDDGFTNGSKETQPGGWKCGNSSAQQKDDITAGQVSFRTVGGKQFAYVDFTRRGVNGDAHVDYEFSKSTVPNPSCPALPQRTNGDIIISFDTDVVQGKKVILVNAYRWVGNATTGSLDKLATGSQGNLWDGAVNDPNTIPGHTARDFGEAALNITDTIGTIGCGDFSRVYMKTRSSTSIDSALQDKTGVQPINLGACPNSTLDKAVRNFTTNTPPNGAYANSVSGSPNDVIQYQLTYTNAGNAAANNVVIDEPIPANTSFVAGSCTGAVACDTSTPGHIKWTFASVPASGTQVVTFKLQLASSFPGGTTQVKNTATVTSSTETTPKPSDETVVNVTANPNSNLAKAVRNFTTNTPPNGAYANSVSGSPNDVIQYQLSYTNTGNAAATNVVIDEPIPANTSFVAGSCTGSVACDTSTAGHIKWTFASVPAGGSQVVTFKLQLASSFPAGDTGVKNTACVTTGQESQKCSNETTVTVTANPISNLAKAVRNFTTNPTGNFGPSASASPNDVIQYQLTYNNTGNAAATNVVIDEPIPANTSFVAGSCTGSVACDTSTAGHIKWTFASVPAGGSQVVTFKLQLASSFPAGDTGVKNTACVTTGQESQKCSNETTVTVTANPNSSLDKAVRNFTTNPNGAYANSTTGAPGDVIQYQLTYTNTGNAAATNVVIDEPIPSGTSFVTGSCTGSVACDTSTAGHIKWTFASVPAGGSQVVTFKLQLASSLPVGTDVKNTACVKTDQESQKCSDETTVTVTNPISNLDKAVRNFTTNTPPNGAYANSTTGAPGDVIQYQLTYTNSGNAAATNVVIDEPIPSGTSFVAGSCTGSVACDTSTAGHIKWTFASVPAGGTEVVTFKLQLASSFPAGNSDVKNTACVTTGQESQKCSDETTVTVTANPISNLAKAVRNFTTNPNGAFGPSASAVPGNVIQYRLTYTNTGNAPATNVVIDEPIPANTSFVAGSCTGSVACDTSTSGTIKWTFASVPAGGTEVVTFKLQLASSFPAGDTGVKNTACVTSGQEQTPKCSNETTVTVTANPNLAVVKSADKTAAATDDTVTYTLSYSNTGNATATNVVIGEAIPDGTEFAGCSDNCQHSGSDVSWSIGDVPAGTSDSVTLSVRVTTDVGCQICNTATITSPDQNGGTPRQSNQLCIEGAPGPNPAGAHASGDATGARLLVGLLGSNPINLTLPQPASGNPDDPSTSSTQSGVGSDGHSNSVLNIGLPGVLQASLLGTTSRSTVTENPAQAEDTSTAETLGVNILNGVVTADAVEGVANAHADGGSASFSSAGSTFVNLKVLGQSYANVAPNTTIKLPAAVFGNKSAVTLREETGSTTQPGSGQQSGGTYSSDHEVTMIHVKVTNLIGIGKADIYVSRAKAHADFPQTQLCRANPTQEVSGHAFIASETTDPELLPIIEGFVDIPTIGANPPNTQSLASVSLPGDGSIVSTGLASSSSGGTLSPTASTASSNAQAANVCVLRTGLTCAVGATAVKSQSNSLANAGGASSNDAGTQLVGLQIGGVPIAANPPPNTTLNLLGLGTLILNEQFGDRNDADHDGDSDLTVRAIHLILLDPAPGSLPGADVIVAEAHSDATFK